MLDNQMQLAGFDDELLSAIQDEATRQEEHIELIASENYTSPRVLEAQGSISIKAATDLKMEGLSATMEAQTSAEVSGAASAKLKGATTTIAGMTNFSPS